MSVLPCIICSIVHRFGPCRPVWPQTVCGGLIVCVCVRAQDLREPVAMTIATLMAADVLLNPKHVGKVKAVLEKVYKYLGSTLGVTSKEPI